MSKTPYRFLGRKDVDDSNLLKIYCRVKPSKIGSPCFSVLGRCTLVSHPPSPTVNSKPTHFTFKQIFPPDSCQKDVFDEVAFPLIEQVLMGQNALLFTYGNTGSGKTYTMKGTLEDGGIMPRCLDVIFNSVSQKLAPKNTFKNDKFNGFEILSEKEAESCANKALLKQIGIGKGVKTKRNWKHNSDPDLAGRHIDPTQILLVNNNNKFALFVSFIEIYNNNVYDLLEDLDSLHPKAQGKQIREDFKKNMFVFGVTEVEVSSTEQAYEIYYKGLNRRKVAETLLNTQSSRSHSVFNIRVVQADFSDKNVAQKSVKSFKENSRIPITVGQLSLVDLAGSERSSRTQNTGKNLMEAGNINNSLMTLRQCFDALKENQLGGSKMIPYRDSKLTTLFKNYFEGDGAVAMIVCINPSKDDYEETLHVLRFAESTLEIQLGPSLCRQIEMEEVQRQLRVKALLEKEYKDIDRIISKIEGRCSRQVNTQIIESVPVNLQPNPKNYTSYCLKLPDTESFITESGHSTACNFGDSLSYIMKSIVSSNIEKNDIQKSVEMQKEKSLTLEHEVNVLKRKLDETNNTVKRLKRDLFEKDQAILKSRADNDREKERFQIKKNVYKEKFNSELDKRLKRQRTELEMEIQSKQDKLARVHRVLSDEIISTSSTPSVASCRAKFEKFVGTPSNLASTPRIPHSDIRPSARKGTVAVSNRRHRRSKSAGDVWVEHKPAMPVPLNTVLQPSLAKRRSITKLIDAKQVTQGASKYCLMTQTQDSDGDLETRLYKADVIPTSGGGAQVLFNDVEVLKQISPDSSPKRPPREETVDPQPSCSYGIEGHRLRSHRV